MTAFTLPRNDIYSEKSAYATYDDEPTYPYKLIKYMMENNELIWKLLKYNTPDAWNMPNLTMDEKRAMIWQGYGEMTDYRVFMDIGQPDAWTSEVTVVRISNLETIPDDSRTTGTLQFIFEVFSHYKINTMSNYENRVDRISQQFLTVFNGVQLDIGLSRFYFNAKASQLHRTQEGGQIPYKGKYVIMGVKSG